MNHANDNTPVAPATGGLRFLSVCSGIEAASVAWNPLDWQAVAFSEIEKFPSAVLAHHYPDVPNLGDFTAIDTSTLGRIDILAGGTPCQAFSVAGQRQSLADARGNLTLAFVELAHELAEGNGLRNVVWENVLGVLNTKDNAFGCFLGGLVGATAAVQPPRGTKWPNAGMVSGPKGRAAWRVLDAQYFGLAQRRRRVIVVADFGNGADPAAVLFERASLHGNTPPSREARKDVAPTISARTKGGGGLGTDFDLDGGLVEAKKWPADLAPTLNAAFGDKQGLEDQHALNGAGLFVPHAVGVTGETSQALTAEGADASEDGTGRGTPVVSFRIAGSGEAYDEGDRTAPLTTGTDPSANVIAFSAKDYGADATVELSPTLRAGGHTTSHANAGVMPAVAWSIMPQNSGKDYKARQVDVAQPLMAGGPVGGNQGGDYIQQPVTVAIRGREGGATAELGGPIATALRASQGGGDKPHVLTSAVRRLTPVECERLMGFPDNYTLIPYGNKLKGEAKEELAAYFERTGQYMKEVAPGEWVFDRERFDRDWPRMAADGPRYKALGNSWAVPKFRWLGERIARLMPVAAHTEYREAA